MDAVNIPAKFEVRSFTSSWDKGGTAKIWAVPGYARPYGDYVAIVDRA